MPAPRTRPITPELVDRLAAAVHELGGIGETAALLGLSHRAVEWWLSGRSAPTPRMAAKLADLTRSVAEAYLP